MKKAFGFAFVVIAWVCCGVLAPSQASAADAAGNSKKQESNKGTVSPQGFAADQIMKFFGRKTDKKPTPPSAAKVQAGTPAPSSAGKSSPAMPKLSPKVVASSQAGVEKMPGRTAAKSVRQVSTAMAVKEADSASAKASEKMKSIKKLTVPPPPVARMAVPQIRREIQQILDLNKQIRNVQSGRSGQFQRVQEQAQLHQKILNDLENAKRENASRKLPKREDLLEQEKLRIIHEETKRNAELLKVAKTENETVLAKESSKPGAEAKDKKPSVLVKPVSKDKSKKS